MKPAVVPENLLLSLLDGEARSALCLAPVKLHAGEVLHEANMPTLWVYFPASTVISIVATMATGASAEVALVGREGMEGLGSLLGIGGSPTSAIVQIAGTAFRTTTAVLKSARLRFASVQTVLDRYTETRLIQMSQIAACNSLHPADGRLARWLLAINDRIDGDRFKLSQELIAHMLGLQRPTVSVAMQRLQDSNAVVYDGRWIVVADRTKLERLACECYGVLRRNVERLRRSVVVGPNISFQTAATPSHRDESAAAAETMRQIAGRLLLANIQAQQAREEVEAANRVKDQFLAMASHEMRTPLNAILGWCAMASKPGQKQSVDHALRVIERNAAAQLTMVDALVDAARVASTTLTIEPAMMHLGGIVQDAVDAAKPMADEKQVALHLIVPDDLPPLWADADRLRQVFSNVVTNAVKFTEPGGSVDVSVAVIGREAQVTIRDTGRGIAPALLPHVFDRFRQGEPPVAGVNGLGLGLTIAQALVELHGGRIQMASPGEGLGTTCTIELPLPRGGAPSGALHKRRAAIGPAGRLRS